MRLLLPLLLTGCLDAEKFDTDHTDAYCLLLTECEALDLYGFSSQDACLEDAQTLANECESFDNEAAERCLTGVEGMGCEALLDAQFPAACSDVCGTE